MVQNVLNVHFSSHLWSRKWRKVVQISVSAPSKTYFFLPPKPCGYPGTHYPPPGVGFWPFFGKKNVGAQALRPPFVHYGLILHAQARCLASHCQEYPNSCFSTVHCCLCLCLCPLLAAVAACCCHLCFLCPRTPPICTVAFPSMAGRWYPPLAHFPEMLPIVVAPHPWGDGELPPLRLSCLPCLVTLSDLPPWAPTSLLCIDSCPMGPTSCTTGWHMMWVLSCVAQLLGKGAMGS